MKDRDARAKKWRERPDPELTFEPRISSASQEIVSQSEGSRSVEDVWSAHHLEARRRSQAQLRLNMLYERELSRESTFRPHVSELSQRLCKERRSRSAPPCRRDIHDTLFHDAADKRRAKMQQEHRQLKDAASSGVGSSSKLTRERLNELVTSSAKRDTETLALREYLHRHQDPITGQRLFRPRINRGPQVSRNEQGELAGLHMGEALFASRDAIRRPREDKEAAAARAVEAQLRMPCDGRFTRGRSDRLVQRQRRQRLRQIFDQVDYEGEGVLDGATLADRLALLPKEVVGPLLPTLAGVETEMFAFSDFEALVERRLAAEAPSGPRSFLLPARGDGSAHSKRFIDEQRAQAENCSFAPRVDRKSQKIAKAKRRPGLPLHDELYDLQAEYEQRRAERRRHKQEAEDKECTFRPEVNRNAKGRRSSGSALPHGHPVRSPRATSLDREVTSSSVRSTQRSCLAQPPHVPAGGRTLHVCAARQHGAWRRVASFVGRW
jgi:hypothetical protein